MSQCDLVGYRSYAEFAQQYGYPSANAIAAQMYRGYCTWPRQRQVGRNTHPLRGLYRNIKRRTTCPTSKDYINYGKRGIKLCTEWFTSFEAFVEAIEMLGPRPEGYSLDRIDNDRGYEPGNIRWASRQQQNLNQRRNHHKRGTL